MSIKGQIKEAAGFVKEEANEHGKSPESQGAFRADQAPRKRRTAPCRRHVCQAKAAGLGMAALGEKMATEKKALFAT
jgi:hypothetical protein